MLDEFSLILDMAIVLGAALAGGLTARFLKQSAIIGYLLAGVVIGPHMLGLIQESDEIRVLATIGVVLLLFTLGVKFSATISPCLTRRLNRSVPSSMVRLSVTLCLLRFTP